MKIRDKIEAAIERDGIALLPPMDVMVSTRLLQESGIHTTCTILDPWYNKGTGGVLPDAEYDKFIRQLLDETSQVTDQIYLWGFPEIIGPYVRFAPDGFAMQAWLTWYYKNCPSVIRGWRSSQNACIQFCRTGSKLHPENFLSDEQLERYQTGAMRFVPGPPSVIEAPLIIGVIGKKEQTGHPSQKPEAVFAKLIQMSTEPGEAVFDPMAGSGTTGACARALGRKAILCDKNEEYIEIIERRLKIRRIAL